MKENDCSWQKANQWRKRFEIMRKEADKMMDYLELAKTRSSCRKYTDEPVSEEDIRKIILAANAAPVGSSRYDDIHLTVVKDRKVLFVVLNPVTWQCVHSLITANLTRLVAFTMVTAYRSLAVSSAARMVITTW